MAFTPIISFEPHSFPEATPRGHPLVLSFSNIPTSTHILVLLQKKAQSCMFWDNFTHCHGAVTYRTKSVRAPAPQRSLTWNIVSICRSHTSQGVSARGTCPRESSWSTEEPTLRCVAEGPWPEKTRISTVQVFHQLQSCHVKTKRCLKRTEPGHRGAHMALFWVSA